MNTNKLETNADRLPNVLDLAQQLREVPMSKEARKLVGTMAFVARAAMNALDNTDDPHAVAARRLLGGEA